MTQAGHRRTNAAWFHSQEAANERNQLTRVREQRSGCPALGRRGRGGGECFLGTASQSGKTSGSHSGGVAMAAQPCGCASCHRTVCFAWLRWQILHVFFESYKKSNEGDKDPPVRARHTDVPGGPTRVNCLPSLPAGTRPQDTVRTTEATWASTSSHSPPQSRGRTYKRRRGQSYRMTTPDMQGFHALPTGLCAIYEGTMRPGQEEA